ncbi:hypothetical protein [Massilia glaciei]|uniref:Uncharacterized protein n=1 Tax=Massilia glaciei TaxID=1524097 RepID=A0A2U2HJ79_9BURK|nr:hypothetical protein [Massilia glaciei]PWF46762.1 hypothetical protein C7C56_015295 [Massilia glaciei]
MVQRQQPFHPERAAPVARPPEAACYAPAGKAPTHLRELAVEGALARTWTSLNALLRSASGIPARLGELLLLAHKVTPEQLNAVLAEQKQTGQKIGVLLVQRGHISESELDAILALQKAPEGSQGALRLGSILLALGKINHTQLADAIRMQRDSGKLLGDILQEAGYVASVDIERGLTLQRRLQRSAVVALFSFVSLSTGSLAHAAQNTSTMRVSVSVLPYVQLKVISQVEQLRVTQADIARGYVDVASGSHIAIKSNSRAGYVLAFDNLPDEISSVQISGLEGAVEIGSDGGSVVQRLAGGAAPPIELSYRFKLASGMQPGEYQWPVNMSARAL